jgi:hypothetical protein
MRRGRVRWIVVVLGLLAALALPSCGFKRKLVSITVIPDTVTLGGPDLTLQFKAVGNYIHPPDSRDITNSVGWESAAPDVVSIEPSGLAKSGIDCGTNITITATGHSDPHDEHSGIVVGIAAVTVTCPPPPP